MINILQFSELHNNFYLNLLELILNVERVALFVLNSTNEESLEITPIFPLIK